MVKGAISSSATVLGGAQLHLLGRCAGPRLHLCQPHAPVAGALLAGSVVGAGLGEIEKWLKMKASSHGRAVSLFGMAPGRVHLSRSVQGVAAHLS